MDINSLKSMLNVHGIDYSEMEPLSAHTTFKIGGRVEVYASPKNIEELCIVVSFCKKQDVPYMVLGRGSNVLFDDCDFSGCIVSVDKINSIEVKGEYLICGAGASFTQTVAIARDNSLSGLEFAFGIPGTVGGAVFMNAGAYGGTVADVLVESTYFDGDTGKTVTIKADDHKFGYRESVYRENKNYVIISATFKLTYGEAEVIKEKMNGFMTSRRTKQPLEYPSAGSVFKRPEGYFAGQLIEEAGLKGYAIGGAQVSEKHAGFIINRGGATAADVMELVKHIQNVIMEKNGVTLECELIQIKEL